MSTNITLEKAVSMRDEWIDAEQQVMLGQSVTIQGRTVVRADLKEIRNAIQFWSKKAKQLSRKKRGKGSLKISGVVPVDR